MKIVPRSQWGAQPPINPPQSLGPVSTVVIHHDAAAQPPTVAAEKARMRVDQNYHQTHGYNDIAYAFGVGLTGVYEGRGFRVLCGATEGWNDVSVPIMFMGNYETVKPKRRQLRRAGKLIRRGVKNGAITKTYDVIAHRDTKATACPGHWLYAKLDRIDHYSRPIQERFVITATRVIAGRERAKRLAYRLKVKGWKVTKERKP